MVEIFLLLLYTEKRSFFGLQLVQFPVQLGHESCYNYNSGSCNWGGGDSPSSAFLQRQPSDNACCHCETVITWHKINPAWEKKSAGTCQRLSHNKMITWRANCLLLVLCPKCLEWRWPQYLQIHSVNTVLSEVLLIARELIGVFLLTFMGKVQSLF